MRVLLTGATGFLGRRLVPLLADHEVLCPTRRVDALAEIPHVVPLAADLNDPTTWTEAVLRFRPECCLHLAWEGLPDYSLSRCRQNLDTSIRLIEVLAESGVQRVVVAGSCWEYGRVTGQVAETTEPRDCGVFAVTKHALRTMVEGVARAANFEYRWARIFFVYGSGQRPVSLIPSAREAFRAGRVPEIREPGVAQDFIHVDDAARALVALAESPADSGIYNIGTGVPTTVGAVVNRVARHYEKPALFAAGRPITGFWADISRITGATGWTPTISVDAGVEQTLTELDAA